MLDGGPTQGASARPLPTTAIVSAAAADGNFLQPIIGVSLLFGVCAGMHASGCKQGDRDAVMHTMPTESRHGAREMLASFPQAARLFFHGQRGGQLACSRADLASRVAGAHKAIGCTRSAARRCRLANAATSSEKPGRRNRQAAREPGPWPARRVRRWARFARSDCVVCRGVVRGQRLLAADA